MTAQAGPAVLPTMPDTNATVYNASATCATVPKTAQMVPDMTDFLAGLQVSPLPCLASHGSLSLTYTRDPYDARMDCCTFL